MERDRSIDIAKGIGIVLMVMGHCYHEQNLLLKLIYAFHMPFFFVVTGILQSFHGGGTELPLRKWFRRLIVPYFFFEFLFAFLLAALAMISHHDPIARFWECAQPTLLLIGKTVTWYLPCLFFAKILFALIQRIHYQTLKITVLTVLFVIGVLAPLDGEWMVLERSFVGLGFMSFGYYFKKQFSNQAPLPALCAACIIYIVSGLVNEPVSMVVCKYGNGLLYVLSSISGSYLLLQFSQAINKYITDNSKVGLWLKYFGRNTLTILGSHMLVIEIVRLLDYKLFGNLLYRFGLLEGFVFGAIVMLAEIPIIFIMKRYMAFILGSTKG